VESGLATEFGGCELYLMAHKVGFCDEAVTNTPVWLAAHRHITKMEEYKINVLLYNTTPA
jgi:hypothetical protein